VNAEVGTLEPKVRTRRSTGRSRSKTADIPLIDVFAGCGGFSEGFLAYSGGSHQFSLSLALDNDEHAHRTHLLRAFFHQFETPPDAYYELLQSSPIWEDIEAFFEVFPEEAEAARKSVLLRELGSGPEVDEEIHSLIDERLQGRKDWVLIGGPPCQAYSIAGRSRNRGTKDYEAESDHRHFLYREYLKILAQHWPAVFVMENVPGVLNSRVGGDRIWEMILEDLADPVNALSMLDYDGEYDGYRLYSLVTPDRGIDFWKRPSLDPDEFIVQCEEFGIPQSRHRIFVLGVRSDLFDRGIEPRQLEKYADAVPCSAVIEDLPRLRSGLTRTDNSDENWLRIMRELVDARWWKSSEDHSGALAEARKFLGGKLKRPEGGLGGQFVPGDRIGSGKMPAHLKSWLVDSKLPGACNHESKAHMESDIHRYVFAACHSRANSDQPLRLVHFPEELLPDHENVKTSDQRKLSHSNFADRFAVQVGHEPARTIVSHIAKDGHYYIHPDPAQGRSLSVREAARVQTFPDNYFFPGPRTEQYRQVGNAVPPYLAHQIAGIIDDILEQAGR
jgi:DNA (cytosine-5)-methyltransferase 1